MKPTWAARHFGTHAFALFGFVLLAVYATWPLARFAASRVASDLADPLEGVWIFSWAAHALAHDPLGVFDANMFFPERFSLAYAENLLGLSVWVAPVFWITDNGILTANVAVIGAYAASGFGAYLLARELGAPAAAAFLAGAAYGLAPYRVNQIHHPHIVAIHLLPFVLVLLLRLRNGSPRKLVLAIGVVLALQFWSSIYGGILTLVTVATWAGWELCVRGRQSLGVLRLAAAGVTLATVLIVPLAVPYLAVRARHPEFLHLQEEVLRYSATPGSYLVPPEGGPLTSSSYAWIRDRLQVDLEAGEDALFPGWGLTVAFLVASAAGAVSMYRHRFTVKWTSVSLPLLLAVVGFVLSLGPRLGRRPDGLPLPFALLSKLGPGELLRGPARFATLVLLGMAIVVAIGLTHARSLMRRWLIAGLGVVIALELMPPSVETVSPPAITAAHRAVSNRKGAVLGLPTFEPGAILNVREALHLYHSTAHFRPIVNGYGAFQPRSWKELNQAVQDFPDDASLSYLRTREITTVIVETRFLGGTRWEKTPERLDRWPGVRLIAKSDGVLVYDITAAKIASSL